MKNCILSLLTCTAMAVPAAAQDRFDTPVAGDVLPGWVQSDGTRIAALRLTLAPGWKTYWRAPGDAGIPPQFDWSASENLARVTVDWPAPKVFDQNGYRSVGYENTLIIPLRIEANTSGQPVQLEAQMDLGICSDVCIPHQLEFSAEITSEAQTPTPAIAAALAERPYTASEAGVRAAVCAVRPTSDGLRIAASVTMPSAGGEEYVVIEPGLDEVWVSEAKTTRSGNTVTAVSEMVHIAGGAIALDRSNIRITVLGNKYAVDVRGCSAS